jgi:hypothetical protein
MRRLRIGTKRAIDHDVLRRIVQTLAEKARVAQNPVLGPLGETRLDHDLRRHPKLASASCPALIEPTIRNTLDR